MSGIKDVARKAGVSISTVSNVLNHSKFVSSELTQRVERAVEELKYEANPIARSMKNNRSGTIGVITEDICGVFYPYIVKGINSVIADKGYQLIICDIQGTYGDKQAIRREEEFFRRLIASRVDGIIFVSSVAEKRKEKYLAQIVAEANKFKRIPLVSLERNFVDYGIDSVYFDGYENAIIATEHLMDCGCRHIGHIAGPKELHISNERVRGVMDCLHKHQFPCPSSCIVYGDYSHQSGYLAMRKLLENMPEIDGVFCGNDQMAVGALKALKTAGRSVPEDIKMIGYDDVFLSSIIEPSISTIHIRKRHAGIEAAKILIARIEATDDAYLPQAIKMDAHLVKRQSTTATEKDDWRLTEW